MRWRRSEKELLRATAVVSAAALSMACAATAQNPPLASPTTTPTSAPAATSMAFAATTLSGDSLVFPNDFAGKLVLVSFWATWCPVCGREMPYWKEAEQRFRGTNLVFVGILTDEDRHASREKIEAHVRKVSADWPQIFENGASLSHEFLVEALPHSFLVDGDTGKVLKQGDMLRKKRLMPQLDKAFSDKFPGIALPPPATQPVATQPTSRPASQSVAKPESKQPVRTAPPASQPATRP